VNGLYKTELIRQRGLGGTVEQVALATLEYVWWWNNQRLHGELDMRTPTEVEHAYYADLESDQPAPAGQGNRFIVIAAPRFGTGRNQLPRRHLGCVAAQLQDQEFLARPQVCNQRLACLVEVPRTESLRDRPMLVEGLLEAICAGPG